MAVGFERQRTAVLMPPPADGGQSIKWLIGVRHGIQADDRDRNHNAIRIRLKRSTLVSDLDHFCQSRVFARAPFVLIPRTHKQVSNHQTADSSEDDLYESQSTVGVNTCRPASASVPSVSTSQSGFLPCF